MLRALFGLAMDTLKETVEGGLLSATSQVNYNRFNRYFEENDEDYAVNMVIDDITSFIQHKGTSDDPYTESDTLKISAAFSLFKDKRLYYAENRLISAMEDSGYDTSLFK